MIVEAPRVADAVDLYRSMLRIRTIEEAIADRYADAQMRCPVHLSIGQEAAAVGICSPLRADDYAITTHRPHAHYLAKGGNLRAFIAELYGRATGCAGGRGGSMHVMDLEAGIVGSTPIVGGSLPLGVGTAFATHLDGGDRVSVVFFGDGTTEEGVFMESLNFAALHKLNVIFACENNSFSVYSPIEVRQAPGRSRAGIAAASGLPTGSADGNDVLAVRDAMQIAIDRARSGGGPTYLEFETYRFREHCGPNFDNDLNYRSEAEFQSWLARDPVPSFERKLLADGTLSATASAAIRAEIVSEIDDAFAFALASPFPPVEDLMKHVYREPNA